MDYFVILQIIISFRLLAMLVNQVRKMHRKPQNSAVLGETPAVAESLADSDRSWRYKTSPPSKKRPWWRLYGVTLGIALVGVVQTGHHAWFEYSNPPPLFDELQMQRVEVLGWQRQHPQLHVRLPDGSSRMVEFPTLRLGKGGDLYYVISFEAQRQLVGQTCQMWGRPLSFNFQDSYQVFALECNQGGRLSFDMAFKEYKKSFENRTSFTFSIGIYIWLFGVALFFWAETIRNRKDR